MNNVYLVSLYPINCLTVLCLFATPTVACVFKCFREKTLEDSTQKLQYLTVPRTFKTQHYDLGDGVSIIVYVYKQRGVIQLMHTYGPKQIPSRLCMNGGEFHRLSTNTCTRPWVFDRIVCKPKRTGCLVYRRGFKDQSVQITNRGLAKLRRQRELIFNMFTTSVMYNDGVLFKSSTLETLSCDLLIACAVYFDTYIRESGCNGCRNKERVDIYQNTHSCAFENDVQKRSRATDALRMVEPELICSILASNGLPSIQPTLSCSIQRHRESVVRKILTYSV